MIFFADKKTVAQFVADLAVDLRPDSLSITITVQGRSGDCYVSIVTASSLEDIVAAKASNYSWLPLRISTARILAG